MDSIAWQKPPPAWEILRDGRYIRIGGQTVRLADVAGCRPWATAEPNISGHVLALGVFLVGALAFLLPVSLGLARPKFLIGTALFMILGVCVAIEIFKRPAIRLYRLEIELADGDAIEFATTHPAEVDALAAALCGAGPMRAR